MNVPVYYLPLKCSIIGCNVDDCDSFPPRFWNPRPPDAPYCPERNFARPCGKSVKAQTGDKEEGGTEEPSMLKPSKKCPNFKHQCWYINVDTSWGFLKSHKVHSWRQKSTQKSFTLHEAEVCLPEVAYSMFSPSLEVREIFREASLGDSRESIDPVNSEHSSDSSPANSSSHKSSVVIV